MKRLLSILLAALCAACTTTPPTETAAHPEWSYNAVVYEITGDKTKCIDSVQLE